MHKLATITASLLTLTSLAIFGSQAGVRPLRETLLAVPLTPNLGGDGTRPVSSDAAFSFQTVNSPKQHQRPFSFGNRLFNTNWVVAPASVKTFDGLGPLFNRVSCSGCHTKDGRGQPPETNQGPMDSMLLRISIPGVGKHGGVVPHPKYGDQISERAILGVKPEGKAEITYTEIPGTYADGEAFSLRKPNYKISDLGYGDLGNDILISPRVAPSMIGLGLLQAVPDETLAALSDPHDSDGDGISGRPNEVWDSALEENVFGRFGWKANQPNLQQQNASAAAGDMGITTTFANVTNDPDMSDEFLKKLTLYTMTLAVPAQRNGQDETVKKGQALFANMGCSGCHMPTLKSGVVTNFPELSNQTFHPFTDLLLHNMGEGLSDNRPDFAATGQEWRTAPLWGLGLVPTVNKHHFLLHDGRARGPAEAILWHGGEAEKSKATFRTADKEDRDALIAFLNSL
jgi:CxxC motif-containing protein (DUF1111 family)